MYLTDQGLGAPTTTGGCCAWENDRKSFAAAVAQHYVKTELGKSLEPKSIWCSEVDPVCEVKFPGDITVTVSFVNAPDHVIARQHGADKPRREYNYKCAGKVELILSPRKSK